jgi:hypothetical protein
VIQGKKIEGFGTPPRKASVLYFPDDLKDETVYQIDGAPARWVSRESHLMSVPS